MMSINVKHRQAPSPRQMLHIRLPQDLHNELRAVAADRKIPLQRLAEEAFRDALAATTVPSEAGLLAVYPNRNDRRLPRRIAEAFGVAQQADLSGLTLLDFLAEDGWGYGPLVEGLAGGVDARLTIADRDSPATRARLATTYGIPYDDDKRIRSCAKYAQLEYAEKLLDALAAAENVETRRHALAPSWRWTLACDDVVLAEPHLPRLRDGRSVSTALMPVFEFDARSPAGERLREHFETLWDSPA